MKRDPFRPGLLHRLAEAPRKVAVLRASRIGDFLCATPALRSLRRALPHAEISLITLPLLRDIAVRLSYVDRFIPFPGFPGIAEQMFEPRRSLEFLRRMQEERFDLAIQMQGTGVHSNPFILLMAPRAAAGFLRAGDPPGLLDAALPLPQSGHEAERMLALPLFLGAPAEPLRIDFPLSRDDREAATRLLDGLERPLIGIHPVARDPARRWPLERFYEAGMEMRPRRGGTLVVIADGEHARETALLCERFGPPCLDLSAAVSLPVLGAVIERLSVLVTNDSGPAHIAYALGTPAVTLVGRGDAARYGPAEAGPFRLLTVEGAPDGCEPDCLCLDRISVEQALSAVDEVMKAWVRSS